MACPSRLRLGVTSTPESELFLIVNPRAGAGRGIHNITGHLRERGVPFTVAATTGRGDAAGLARLACRAGVRAIVCVGGDGTLNEIVNGCMTADGDIFPDVVLGHIPSGTAQDFARSAGLPLTRYAAVDFLLAGNPAPTDVGRIRFSDGRSQFFINAMGAGFDAEVADRAAEVRGAITSVPAHLVGLASALAAYRPGDIDVSLDRPGLPQRRLKATMVVVANGPSYAGLLQLAPNASLDDGLLDAVAFRHDLDHMDFFLSLPRVLTAGRIEHEKVETHPVASVTLESEERCLVHADGEVVGRLPARVDVLPGALRVIR